MKDSTGVAPTVTEQRKAVRVGGLSAARDRISIRGAVTGLIPFALAFAVYLLVFIEMRPLGATGDEPHYLVTAESIAYDFDVDLRNDYASRERVLRVVNVFPLGPHGSVFKESGELRPWRGVGLPTLLAPGVGLGGLTGARVVMLLIAALLADQLYRLLRDLRFRRSFRILAWVAAVFCLPLVVFTSQIYPEIPGALLLVVALRVMVAGRLRPAALALGSAAAAALVWLHVRYASLSLAIIAGLVIAACSAHVSVARRGGGLRGHAERARDAVSSGAAVLVHRWRTVTLPIVTPYAIGLGLLAVAFQHWYGSPNPQIAYEPFGSPGIGGGGWDFWYQFGVRDILDPKVGWIPFAPVHWLGLALLGCLVLRFGWPAAACVAAAAGYVLLVASVGPNIGFGMPGRYPMIVIPLIAIPLALGIQKIRAALVIFVPLLALSIVFAVAAVRDYGKLYPAEAQQIFGLRSIATAFPEPTAPEPPGSFTVAPDGPPSPATGRLERGLLVARAGRDRPGFLRFGPYTPLKAAAYRARFSLAGGGVRPQEPVAVVEVVSGGTVFAREVVTGRRLQPRGLAPVELSFATPGVTPIETRVYYMGRGTLQVGPIDVQPIAPPVAAETHFRDWPVAFLWLAGTILVGWLFVEVMRLSRQRAPTGAGEPRPN